MWFNLAADIEDELSVTGLVTREEIGIHVYRPAVEPLAPRPCRKCGRVFQVTHANQRHCPRHRRPAEAEILEPRTCPCGLVFTPRVRNQTNCERRCYMRRTMAARRARALA